MCLLLGAAAELLNPALPFPLNYGGTFEEEEFYWAGDALMDTNGGGQAILVMGLKAGFVNGPVIAGEQMVFGRIRIRVDNLVQGQTYTITTPYGTFNEVATRTGRRGINFTQDIGLVPGAFSLALSSGIGPFLRWNSDLPIVDAAGREYIGDPAIPHTVTGSPTGNNFFRIVGPNVGGPGINTISTNLFNVMGQVGVPPPLASFTVAPAVGIAPLSVTFTDTSTGTVTARSWDFGDGSTSLALNPVHVYATPGVYTVSLTATGPGGSTTAVVANAVTVNAPAPVAAFTATPVTGLAPLSVTFANTSANATTYAWNFGDGTTSAVAAPVHVYAAAGTYTVSLTATGPGGANTSTQVGLITVTSAGAVAPVADFSATPVTGTAPLSVTFTNATTGNATSFAWNFGDGTTSVAASPVHVYAAAGTYTVSLTATGPGGSNTATRTGLITVTSAPAIVNPVLAAPVPGTAGVNNTFTITGCTPGSSVTLYIASATGTSFVTVGGVRVRSGLSQPTVLGTGVANADGTVTLNIRVSTQLRNRTRRLQAVDVTSRRFSNVVTEVF